MADQGCDLRCSPQSLIGRRARSGNRQPYGRPGRFLDLSLFKPGGLLLVDNSPVDGASRLSAGSDQIRQTAATLCRQNFVYLAETRRIWQSGTIALLRGSVFVVLVQV
jgi:hypothetical protein